MASSKATIRLLKPADLDRVVEIDQRVTGHSRRGFYDKRLAAAAAEPTAFINLAAEAEGQVKGFLLAHILDGEFGGSAPVAVLDTMGIDSRARGAGLARELMSGLNAALKSRGVKELITQVDMSQQDLIGFFLASGFGLAARPVLERQTSTPVDF